MRDRHRGPRLPYGAGHRLPPGEHLAYAGCGCRHDLDLTRDEFLALPLIECACGEITGRKCPACGLVY